ncbi:YdcF family protein [Roseivirga sp. BDSF3-8]|uniref:YdcF family protein n=1 Tax=Roseivirga sp. BDSF3-8 TaxID=3241598 RepID=UPI003532059C
MFFFLSKTLYLLVMPVMWLFYLLLLTLFGPKRMRRGFLVATLALFYFLTNGVVVNELLLWWEREPVRFSEVQPCDTGVLLTGFTYMSRLPADRLHYNEGADRLAHTIRLYHEGRIRRIIVSGAYETLHISVEEAPLIKQALLHAGIPDSVIVMENKSRNTHENAINTARIITERFPDSRPMLITSAFHMRRAEACFRQVGLDPVIFPTDFRASNQPYTFEYFFPSESSLDKWQTLSREWLGMLAYKVKGYI